MVFEAISPSQFFRKHFVRTSLISQSSAVRIPTMRPEVQQELSHILLTELLAYQFASPVRWYVFSTHLHFPTYMQKQLLTPESTTISETYFLSGLKPKMSF